MSYSASLSGAMKTDTHEISSVAPPSEPTILDQISNDHELIDRLKITPQELEALSKCALLGTLTCKQDMLFILRQIRESGDPEEATKILHPRPEREEDPVPHLARRTIRIPAAAIEPEPSSKSGWRLMPQRFGSVFWVLVLVAGLIWNGLIAISRWSDESLVASTGSVTTQSPAPDAWYSQFDGSHALLWLEILFVGGMAALMYFKTRKTTRRVKARPVRRLR
jgi:hypothetical protein